MRVRAFFWFPRIGPQCAGCRSGHFHVATMAARYSFEPSPFPNGGRGRGHTTRGMRGRHDARPTQGVNAAIGR